jgi:hypothetical protein
MDEIPKSKTQLELEKYERENNLNKPKSSRFENHFKNTDNKKTRKNNSLFNNNDVRVKNNEQVNQFVGSLFNKNPNSNKKLNDAVNGYCIKAILALVFTFFFWPVGLYYAIVALKQIKKNPEMKGKGFAVAAIVICIFHIISFLMILIVGA